MQSDGRILEATISLVQAAIQHGEIKDLSQLPNMIYQVGEALARIDAVASGRGLPPLAPQAPTGAPGSVATLKAPVAAEDKQNAAPAPSWAVEPPRAPVTQAPPDRPAVDPNASITDDRQHLVCIECGGKHRMIKRHLRLAHGLSPDAYRAKWGLDHNYPMAAPGYSDAKAVEALRVGLGTNENKAGGSRQRAAPAALSAPADNFGLDQHAPAGDGDEVSPSFLERGRGRRRKPFHEQTVNPRQ